MRVFHIEYGFMYWVDGKVEDGGLGFAHILAKDKKDAREIYDKKEKSPDPGFTYSFISLEECIPVWTK